MSCVCRLISYSCSKIDISRRCLNCTAPQYLAAHRIPVSR